MEPDHLDHEDVDVKVNPEDFNDVKVNDENNSQVKVMKSS